MTEDLETVRKLHAWNRRLMSFGGCWPLEPTYVKFYIGYAYFTIQLILIIIDLINVFGDLGLMVMNIAESTQQLMAGVKMLALRHSEPLVKIVKQVESGAREESYKDQKEKDLYLEYATVGLLFVRAFSYSTFVPELTYFFMPMEGIIRNVLRNETMEYNLPYRTGLVFNVTTTRTYTLLYISQAPMIYYFYFHALSICFICTLIVHVAGNLSILAYRIRNIKSTDSVDDDDNLESAFRDLTIKHLNIIDTAEKIDDVFNLVLLEELIITTGIIGLSVYNVLTKTDMTSMLDFASFVLYSLLMIGIILIYCAIGELLMRESANVADAYYECLWYTMPTKYKQHMMICMIRAHKPLQLTAGRFYVFELSQFSSVLKTAMAYISMLRTMV